MDVGVKVRNAELGDLVLERCLKLTYFSRQLFSLILYTLSSYLLLMRVYSIPNTPDSMGR